jgi:hypothetical protein
MISVVQTDLIVTGGVIKFLLPLNLKVQEGDATVVLVTWSGTATITGVVDTNNNLYVAGPTANIGSGASQVNVAIFYCLSVTIFTDPFIVATITFSAAALVVFAGFLDLNGATNAVALDSSATGHRSFVGGSDTTTPNITITITNPFEVLIAVVRTPGMPPTITPNSGWTEVSGSVGRVGVFYQTMGSVTGSYNASPCTLGSSVDSILAIIGFSAPTLLTVGTIFAPRFPDTSSPRLADYLYDSLQGDPTFVANPIGPQPF